MDTTYTYNGVTSTPTSDVRLVVAEALMAKVSEADTEPVEYAALGADDGSPMTVTRRAIRQDPATLDKYAALIVRPSEYDEEARFVTVEQFVRVSYPVSGGTLARSDKAAQILTSLGIGDAHGSLGSVRRFTAVEKLTGPYAGLLPSQFLHVVRALGGYLATRRTLSPDRLLRAQDVAALSAMGPEKANATMRRLTRSWAKTAGGVPVLASDGSPVYSATRLHYLALEREDDPVARPAYYVDQVQEDLQGGSTKAPQDVALAVSGDGMAF